MLLKRESYDFVAKSFNDILPSTCANICSEYASVYFDYDRIKQRFNTEIIIGGKKDNGVWYVRMKHSFIGIMIKEGIHIEHFHIKDMDVNTEDLDPENFDADLYLDVNLFTRNLVAKDEFILCQPVSNKTEIFHLLRQRFANSPRHILRFIASTYISSRNQPERKSISGDDEVLTCVIKQISLPYSGCMFFVYHIFELEARKYLLKHIMRHIEEVDSVNSLCDSKNPQIGEEDDKQNESSESDSDFEDDMIFYSLSQNSSLQVSFRVINCSSTPEDGLQIKKKKNNRRGKRLKKKA